MDRNSPRERRHGSRRDREERLPQNRQRPASRSISPPKKYGQGESRREIHYNGPSEEDDQPYQRRPRRSSRSRSPRRRRRRSRSDSMNKDRSKHDRRSQDPDRLERGSRHHGDHGNDSRHRESEDQHHKSHRERRRSRERDRSPPQHSRDGVSKRDRPSDRSSRPVNHDRNQDLENLPLPVEKEMPNYGRSGKLAAETNRVEGTKIVLKYHEPPEARLPPASNDWRMYEFKGKETISTTELSKRSCWLIGREEAVVDFPVAHPSCSSQHAVLQFRFVEKKNEFGERVGKVKLYVLDLESSNGTSLNGDRIDERRFIEVRPGDVVRFGESTREYVFLLA